MKLDSRCFSQEAYRALMTLRQALDAKYYGKASSLVQGLPAFIATWGLHRLSGEMKKFENRSQSASRNREDTGYKGQVYRLFLERLKAFDPAATFDPDDEGSLVYLDLRQYTALNRLAMQLAKEWSFWAVAILGEAQDD